MPMLRRLWRLLCAPVRGLRALCQLPSALRQWSTILYEHTLVIRESNDLFREVLLAIGHGPAQTPETPSVSSGPMTTADPRLQGMLSAVPPPEPLNPHRIRTARDVTYSSRYLRERDDRVTAAQAPWRQPEG